MREVLCFLHLSLIWCVCFSVVRVSFGWARVGTGINLGKSIVEHLCRSFLSANDGGWWKKLGVSEVAKSSSGVSFCLLSLVLKVTQ